MPDSSGEEEDALHLNDFLEFCQDVPLLLDEAKIPDDINVNGPLIYMKVIFYKDSFLLFNNNHHPSGATFPPWAMR